MGNEDQTKGCEIMKYKKYFLDGLSNYVFFTPIVALMTGLLAHWTWEQLFYYVGITAIIIGFGTGAIYGRFINWWRQKFRYQ